MGDNRIDIILDDGGRASAWWATKNEWLGLIDLAGLEREALYGGFATEQWTGKAQNTCSSPAVRWGSTQS